MCDTVSVSWERLHDIEESCDMLAQLEHGTTTMVSSDGVMHCLPQPFDDIDPGVVDRLEQQLELGVGSQPTFNQLALVDSIVVEDEHQLVRTPIAAAKLFEEFHEQHRVLAVMFDPHQEPGMCM